MASASLELKPSLTLTDGLVQPTANAESTFPSETYR